MIKNLLIALVAVSWFCTAYAHEYVPMIREDRVWQYSGMTYYSSDWDVVYHSLKFDGSTITVNDKTYHTFTYVNSKYIVRDLQTREEFIHHEKNYNGDFIKYFLREEPGKVFLLTYIDDNEEYQYSTIKPLSDAIDNSKIYSECIIYDFTMPDGGLFEARLTSERGSGHRHDRSWLIVDANPSTLHIDGEDCRFLAVYNVDWLYNNVDVTDDMRPTEEEWYSVMYLPWIEGIGVLRTGCLADYELDMISGGSDNSDYLGQNTRIHSVYKTDGTVIYGEQPAGVGMVEVGNLKLWRSEGAVRATGEGNLTVTVCSVDGVKYDEAVGDSDVSVDTSSLPRGIYVVTAEANGEHRTMKIRI